MGLSLSGFKLGWEGVRQAELDQRAREDVELKRAYDLRQEARQNRLDAESLSRLTAEDARRQGDYDWQTKERRLLEQTRENNDNLMKQMGTGGGPVAPTDWQAEYGLTGPRGAGRVDVIVPPPTPYYHTKPNPSDEGSGGVPGMTMYDARLNMAPPPGPGQYTERELTRPPLAPGIRLSDSGEEQATQGPITPPGVGLQAQGRTKAARERELIQHQMEFFRINRDPANFFKAHAELVKHDHHQQRASLTNWIMNEADSEDLQVMAHKVTIDPQNTFEMKTLPNGFVTISVDKKKPETFSRPQLAQYFGGLLDIKNGDRDAGLAAIAGVSDKLAAHAKESLDAFSKLATTNNSSLLQQNQAAAVLQGQQNTANKQAQLLKLNNDYATTTSSYHAAVKQYGEDSEVANGYLRQLEALQNRAAVLSGHMPVLPTSKAAALEAARLKEISDLIAKASANGAEESSVQAGIELINAQFGYATTSSLKQLYSGLEPDGKTRMTPDDYARFKKQFPKTSVDESRLPEWLLKAGPKSTAPTGGPAKNGLPPPIPPTSQPSSAAPFVPDASETPNYQAMAQSVSVPPPPSNEVPRAMGATGAALGGPQAAAATPQGTGLRANLFANNPQSGGSGRVLTNLPRLRQPAPPQTDRLGAARGSYVFDAAPPTSSTGYGANPTYGGWFGFGGDSLAEFVPVRNAYLQAREDVDSGRVLNDNQLNATHQALQSAITAKYGNNLNSVMVYRKLLERN